MTDVATDKEIADVVRAMRCNDCRTDRKADYVQSYTGTLNALCSSCYVANVGPKALRIRPEPVKVEAIEDLVICDRDCGNIPVALTVSSTYSGGHFYCAEHAPSGARYFRQPETTRQITPVLDLCKHMQKNCRQCKELVDAIYELKSHE